MCLGCCVTEQPVRVVEAEHDAVQRGREQGGIGVSAEVPFVYTGAKDLRDGLLQVGVVADELVADGAGSVVVLCGGLDEQAAARHSVAPAGEPVLEQCPNPWLAARRSEGGPDHGVDELFARLGQDLQLQRLLGLGVCEQPALRHAGSGGQFADGEAGQADPRSGLHAAVQDSLPSRLALAHGRRIVRPFVNVQLSAARSGFSRKVRLRDLPLGHRRCERHRIAAL